MVMLHIKLEVIMNAATRKQIFAQRPPPKSQTHTLSLGIRSKGKNFIFLVHGHFAYQIEENQKYSNMVAEICPQTPSLDPACQKVNIQTFSENTHVTYQIKWKNECSNIVANILLADKPGFNFFRLWSCWISN